MYLLEIAVNQQPFWLREKNVFTSSFKLARRYKDARVAKNAENRMFSTSEDVATVLIQHGDWKSSVNVSRSQFILTIDHENIE